jgi:hypothetical protein
VDGDTQDPESGSRVAWVRGPAALLAAACLAGVTGCGSSHPARSTAADREWIDNTAGVIDQLQRDVQLGSSSGDTVGAAREMLRNGLYPVLVAYTDFGGCRHMVAAAGAPPPRYARVTQTLASVCARLQRAAALFTRAASRNDAAVLVRAGRVAASASPFLLRAKVELQAAATSR